MGKGQSDADYARLLDSWGASTRWSILDLGTGITDPLAQFAIERADQP